MATRISYFPQESHTSKKEKKNPSTFDKNARVPALKFNDFFGQCSVQKTSIPKSPKCSKFLNSLNCISDGEYDILACFDQI